MGNILLLGLRRRIYFCKKISKAASFYGMSIVGADTDFLDPIRFHCDSFFLIPHHDRPNYRSALLKLCTEQNVSLIIPWNDKEILVLSRMREFLESYDITLCLPHKGAVEIFSDKFLTSTWLSKNCISAPQTFLSIKEAWENSEKGVIAKPRFGQGSYGIQIINNSAQLYAFTPALNEEYIFQEFVVGKEFTVDVFSSYEHLPIFVSARRRVKTRGGEAMISRIESNQLVCKISNDICRKLKIVGMFNFQIILGEDDLSWVIEMNPRFGGGSDLTIEAGGKFHELMLLQTQGLDLPKKIELDTELVMSRYFSAEFFKFNQ